MTTPDEMACRELVEVITDYLEGAMPDADRARFEAHLEECLWCVNHVEQMRQTIKALGELAEESIPRHARIDLLRAFRAWREE